MSGYSFAVKKKTVRRSLSFSEGQPLPLGLIFDGNALCAGTDALPLAADAPAAEAAFAAGGALLLYGGGSCFVRAAGAAAFSPSSVAFSRIPACVRVYDDAAGEALLLSDGAVCALLCAAGLAQEDVPAFTAAGYAYERLWLATGEQGGARLRYSSFENWRDFTESLGGGGYLDLPDGKGRIVAFADLENYFYVFREYGYQRLYARGDELEFEVRDGAFCARIAGESVAVFGGRAVWLAEDGLHAFDGNTERAFAEEAAPLLCGVPQQAARGCAAGGRYYLQADVRLPQGKKRALLTFATGGAFSVWQGDFGGLTGGVQALAVYGGTPCRLCEGGVTGGLCTRRAWEFGAAAPSGAALLQRLRVDADAGFAIRVTGARGSRSFGVHGGGVQTYPAALFGDSFRVRIEGGGCCGRVRSLTAVWQYEEAEHDE